LSGSDNSILQSHLVNAAVGGPAEAGFSAHVGNLLHAAFGSGASGLLTVQAHQLSARAEVVLRRSLAEAPALQLLLADGARAAASAHLAISFDSDDPRPLLLESRDGRRRRLGPADREAASRLARSPTGFSPHAALRPIVQAATLPVVAQVCGPSELAYLGQARGLHAHFGVEPPVLVPRLEATRITDDDLLAAGVTVDGFRLDAGELVVGRHGAAAMAALQAFADEISTADPSLRARAERLVARTRRDALRLGEAVTWHGRTPPGRSQHLRPRGHPQDTVLAWLPDAWERGDPASWGRRIVELAQPLDPPGHVLYVAPTGEQ
jgi:hypothetical protein